LARCVSRQRRDRAGGSRRRARDRPMREALPRHARRRDRRDLAQRPRRQRPGDPGLREARIRVCDRLRRSDAHGSLDERAVVVICVVVGGGAAGLACAAMLRRAGAEVVVLERDDVGAAWQERYDCLHLHTVRWLSGLPGYGIPRSFGKWPSRDDVVEDLRAYAATHALAVRTGVTVERVERTNEGWLPGPRAGTVCPGRSRGCATSQHMPR